MDIYDGADWTEMDIDDLKAAIESRALDRSIEEAAEVPSLSPAGILHETQTVRQEIVHPQCG
jgi:hypothetical protein